LSGLTGCGSIDVVVHVLRPFQPCGLKSLLQPNASEQASHSLKSLVYT